jgi:hypothetical protein
MFALVAGALFAGLVVVAAWSFRTSAAPLSIKLALPSAMLVAALCAPWPFAAMLGRALPIAADRLPDGARLLALQMFDGDARAQLWLSEGAGTRLYEIEVGPNEKKQLRLAKQRLAGNDEVTIHTGGHGRQHGLDRLGDEGFETEFRSRLPEKSAD